ncbi:MAG: ABC transporter ATP-binding protein [Lachnospiraceae bacterium]|nr:ABC transporter ATP-binding protein [Lachnospiraceae bacterium]
MAQENLGAQKKQEQTNGRFAKNSQMLFYFLRGSKRYFAVSFVSAMLLALSGLVNPRVIGFTVDSVIGDKAFDLPAVLAARIEALGGREFLRSHLWAVALFVVAVAFVNAVFRIFFRMGNSKGAETLLKRTRDSLYAHIIRLPFTWHGAHQTGDIIQRCTSDVETIKSFMAEQLVMLFRVGVLILLAILFMFRIDLTLALITVAFIPVIVGNSLYFHRKIAAAFKIVDEEEGKLSAIAQENLTGVRVVRAFGRERFERERFEKQNAHYAAKDMHLSVIFTVFWSIGSFLSRFQIFIVMFVGALFAAFDYITAGQYIEFMGINAMISWPIRMLGRIISQMSRTGVSVERIRYIMNAEEEEDAADALPFPEGGDIVFDHVSFAYTEETPVLQDVSFTIRAGETVGILGSTGSGKTTLMALLEKLYDLPEGQGKITIGGVDLRRLKRADVRAHIGMVLQEPYLFSRSLQENIKIAKRDATDAERDAAVQIAALDSTVAGFSKGYETMVGERGVTLSGGQKQRTAMAQMLIRRTPVMIFDDSLSAVDTETDEKIRSALKTRTKDATVILIAHRITTLMHADHILVLDKGRLVEEGTHETLIARVGIYHRIYDLQLKAGLTEEDEA